MRLSDVCLILLGLMLLLGANEPRDPANDPLNYARSLSQMETNTTSIDDDAEACLVDPFDNTGCGFYGFGSVTVVKPSNRSTCAVTQNCAGSFTIGAQAAVTEGRCTFGGVTTSCAGYTFAANEPHDLIPSEENLKLKGATHWTGRYCKKPIKGAGGASVHVPCAADAHCNTHTGDNSVGSCLALGSAENTAASKTGSACIVCSPSENATLFCAATER